MPSLSGLLDLSRSCILSLLNFLFLRRDFCLFVVLFDFDLCGPTRLDFSVGRRTDRYLNQLDSENIIDHYIFGP